MLMEYGHPGVYGLIVVCLVIQVFEKERELVIFLFMDVEEVAMVVLKNSNLVISNLAIKPAKTEKYLVTVVTYVILHVLLSLAQAIAKSQMHVLLVADALKEWLKTTRKSVLLLKNAAVSIIILLL